MLDFGKDLWYYKRDDFKGIERPGPRVSAVLPVPFPQKVPNEVQGCFRNAGLPSQPGGNGYPQSGFSR